MSDAIAPRTFFLVVKDCVGNAMLPAEILEHRAGLGFYMQSDNLIFCKSPPLISFVP